MYRILILEDNDEDVELMKYELKAAGLEFEIKQVDSREDFVSALRTFAPDLVLADYSLPEFNGLEALALLQEQSKNVPYVLVSGAIGAEVAAEVVQRGATNFVKKTQMFRLRQVVISAIEQSRKEAQIEQERQEALTKIEDSHRQLPAIGHETVRILLLEDQSDDVLLLESFLRKELHHCVIASVDTESEFRKQLTEFYPDAILADFSLPSFDGLSALKVRQELCPNVPFLFVSSVIGEDVAIESLKLGVTDYVMKDKLSRLVSAVKRALAESRERRLRQAAENISVERQEIIRAVLESASDAFVTIDTEGVIVSVNSAFQKIFGYSEKESVGQRFSKFVSETPSHNSKVSTHATSGTEVVASKKDGSEVFLELSVSEIRVRGTQMLTATIRDITERKNLNRQLQLQVNHLEELNGDLKDARDQAEKALLMKSQFVANISHEIRTPMSGVLGMAELLLMSKIDEESHVIAEHIYLSAKSLLTIVNDILDFSKLEAGKVQLEKREFSVGSVIEQVTQSIGPGAAPKSLKIETEIDEHLPATLYGDDGRIKQTLLNLAHNGIKFTESGSLKIRAEYLGSNHDTAKVRFSVVDTGIGIPADIQSKLFLPFVQADSSTTRRFGGTGLGLSICKSLVSLMAGELGVDSVEGEGSTFWFTLPLDLAGRPSSCPN